MLWAAVVLLFVFVLVNTQTILPHDFWWHLKAGQIIAETGRIPATDAFSFTVRGAAYDNYAAFWLAESALYLMHRWGGPALVIFGHGLAVTAAYALLLVICRRAGGSWPVAALAVLYAAALGFPNWNVRPQGFAYPLAALLLWALDAGTARPAGRKLLLAPLVMLLWANTHGSWTLGAVVLLAWYADQLWRAFCCNAAIADDEAEHPERSRGGPPGAVEGAQRPSPGTTLRQGLIVASSLAAVLVNPRGVGIVRYVVAMARDPVSQTYGREWVAPTFDQTLGAIFLVGLLLTAALLAVSPRRSSLYQAAVFVAFAALALQMIRGIAWFGFAMAPVVAQHLAATLPGRLFGPRPAGASRPRGLRAALHGGLLAAILLAAALSTPWLKGLLPLPAHRQGFVSPDTPVAAVDFLLREQLPRRVFNEQGFGSYLIWAASPPYQVFLDPRLELYTIPIVEDYLGISAAAAGWQEKLDAYGVRTLLLGSEHQPELVRAARASPDWQQIYTDATAVIFVHTTAE